MQFYRKLNELMAAFNITNSRLAKALCVDTSLISRWRTGKRLPSKNSRHVEAIADYFSSYAEKSYQKAALLEIMGITFDHSNITSNEISILIASWLCKDLYSENNVVGGFLEGLSMFGGNRIKYSPEVDPANISGTCFTTEGFSGLTGKMDGVLKFLSIIAAQKKSSTLLLYSDENMDWMVKNKEFFHKWGSLMAQIIEKGNRVKIIHTVNRDLEELLYAIQGWLPLYMTGAIEPYYYPKYRETIFKRTLFIAPAAALTSETIGDATETSYNFLHKDIRVVQSLAKSFNCFLELCRPLMRIISGSNIEGLSELFTEFDRQSGNTLSRLNTLSYITMPEELFKKILEKTTTDPAMKSRILSLHRIRLRSFYDNLEENCHTEILEINKMQKDQNGSIAINLPWLNTRAYYSASDLAEHLENIRELLLKNKNYHLYLDTKTAMNISLTVKEGIGAIVYKSDPSPVVFAFNQENMSDAFYSYLESEAGKIPLEERSKEYVIHKISDLIKSKEI